MNRYSFVPLMRTCAGCLRRYGYVNGEDAGGCPDCRNRRPERKRKGKQ